MAEWLDDPYTNNVVQPWKVASAPQYGCTRVLEVGDPVVGIWFGLNGNNLDTRNSGLWHPRTKSSRSGSLAVASSRHSARRWDGRHDLHGFAHDKHQPRPVFRIQRLRAQLLKTVAG